MKRWFYTSRQVQPFSPAELAALCAGAALRNMAMGLSGFLTYGQGMFQQYLEGPDQAVATMSDVIRADARHEIVSEVPVWDGNERLFSRWGMFDASTASPEVVQLTAGLRFLYVEGSGLDNPREEHELAREVIAAVAEVHAQGGRMGHS